MGKIIEFKNEHELEMGTVLYTIGYAAVNKYKPCPICDNVRTIVVTDIKGNSYDYSCPRCTNQAVKGGNSIQIMQYKVIETKIESFNFDKNFKTPYITTNVVTYEKIYRILNAIDDVENLIAHTNSRYSAIDNMPYYHEKEKAIIECKRLNALEKQKLDAFLLSE